jgi:hypothetical protein
MLGPACDHAGSDALVAVNFFVLSMGELWSAGSEPRLFERHVRGVARFLDSLVQQSVVPDQDTKRPVAGAPQARIGPRRVAQRSLRQSRWLRARRPWGWRRCWPPRESDFQMRLKQRPRSSVHRVGRARHAGARPVGRAEVAAGVGRLPPGVRNADAKHPPSGSGDARRRSDSRNGNSVFVTSGMRFSLGTPAGYEGSAPMLMFEIDEAPGQCVWPERPLPQVECALQVNADEGLVLLWKSKLEDDYGTARPRKTQLSPFARRLSFDYYDSDRQTWTHTEQPQSDGNGGGWCRSASVWLRLPRAGS